jgi:SMC interacting uncharacterized protein involved in chromosome segregation
MKTRSRKDLLEENDALRALHRDRVDRVDVLKAELEKKDVELAALRAELAELRATRRLARTAPARIAPMRKAG